MSSPPPPTPFVPPPTPGAPAGRGCWKTGLIGCGSVALVVLLAFVVGILYLRRNPEKLTDYMMGQIESHFAPDVADEEKRELRAAYADFRSAVVEKRIAPDALQDMRSTLLSGGPGSAVTREQVRSLTQTFRAGAARAHSPGVNRAPAVSTTPTP